MDKLSMQQQIEFLQKLKTAKQQIINSVPYDEDNDSLQQEVEYVRALCEAAAKQLGMDSATFAHYTLALKFTCSYEDLHCALFVDDIDVYINEVQSTYQEQA